MDGQGSNLGFIDYAEWDTSLTQKSVSSSMGEPGTKFGGMGILGNEKDLKEELPGQRTDINIFIYP